MFSINKRKIKLIIIFAALLTMVAIWIAKYMNYDPADIIQSKMYFRLPSNTKIIHFDYNFIDSSFDAKVQIYTKDLESIKKILRERFGDEYDFKSHNITLNRDNIKWWDMDLNIIEACYNFFEAGKNHRMIENWVFVAKQEDGNYYLYLTRF